MAKKLLSSDTFALPNLQDAIALHQLGQLGQAESIYRQLLQSDSKNSDALHLLGVIAHQAGHHQSAVDMIGQAIALKPDYAEAYSNRGNTLKELKQFDAALASYDTASVLIPDYAEWHSPNSVDKYYCQNLNGRNVNAKSQIHS